MKSLSDLGFDGIELGVFDPAVDGSPDEMSRIKQLLESNELEAPNLYIDMAGHWPSLLLLILILTLGEMLLSFSKPVSKSQKAMESA